MTGTSKEYAEALFMLAEESGSEEDWGQALELIRKMFQENPEYMDFLGSPAIPRRERTQAIREAFQGAIPEAVEAFLCLLCEKGHIRSFEECREAYQVLYQEQHAVSVAQVTSVVALTDQEQEQLKSKLEKMCGHRVELECSLDKHLLGGIVVRIDGKIIDGSLKHRLHQIKEVVTG